MSRDRKIAVWATVLAIVALTALVPTAVNGLRLGAQVRDLTAELRSMKERVVIAEVNREGLEEMVSTEVGAVREEVAERFRDILDASAVVERIDDAVFTIESDRAQGTGFGIRSSEGKTWIAGNRFTLADIHLYAFLDFGVGVGQALDPKNARVKAWFDRVAARPSATTSLHAAVAQVGVRA